MIKSARVMKKAVAYLLPYMEEEKVKLLRVRIRVTIRVRVGVGLGLGLGSPTCCPTCGRRKQPYLP